MATPECMERSPLPARVVNPSTKSTDAVGSGSGSQRSWLGVVSSSLEGGVRSMAVAGGGFDFVEGGGAHHAVGGELVGFVHDGGADAIGPGAAVEVARGGEGGAAELLGVEAEGGFLGGVLADGEGAWDGFGGELVAEAGEIAKIGHGFLLGDLRSRRGLRRSHGEKKII